LSLTAAPHTGHLKHETMNVSNIVGISQIDDSQKVLLVRPDGELPLSPPLSCFSFMNALSHL
jgi:hypothetical protein